MAWCATAPAAQPAPASSVLVVDMDFVYDNSRYANQLEGSLVQDQLALQAENRRLFDALRTEELRLTELRDTLSPQDFAALVDRFEAQVTEIRRTQDEKTRTLEDRQQTLRRVFLRRAQPILLEIRQERGATLLMSLDDSVVDFDPEIDISQVAVDRIDSAYLRAAE